MTMTPSFVRGWRALLGCCMTLGLSFSQQAAADTAVYAPVQILLYPSYRSAFVYGFLSRTCNRSM